MLQTEIEVAQKVVKTDAYQMSIGEIVSLYRDGELIINPDFQRLFRWKIGQKSKLIESLLLGIPVPSIFVFETEDSKWELIDGLQRISSILEFMGLLKDPDTAKELPPSSLVGTKYLPSLRNVVWQKSDLVADLTADEQIELDRGYQLAIRRARLGVEILKKPSDNNTKYDLFQRLNAGGTAANPQELRNCIVIMVNRGYYNLLKRLADNANFQVIISVTDDQVERQKHMEYATRFLVHNFIPYDGSLDVEQYIDDGIAKLATDAEVRTAEDRFTTTFALLNRVFGNNALRRIEEGKHVGRVGLAAFECIAVGIGKSINQISSLPNADDFVRDRIQRFWQQPELTRFFAPGMRGTTRIQKTVPFGEKWFRP